MGAVYLARDLQLERDVAVKTLTGMSVSRLMGMKPEAWAMATVTHAAVAQVDRRSNAAGTFATGCQGWRGDRATRKPMKGRRAPGSAPPRVVVRRLRGGSVNEPPRMTHRASAFRSPRSPSTKG